MGCPQAWRHCFVSYTTFVPRQSTCHSFVDSCANPAFTPEELLYQLITTKANLVVAHPDSLEIALTATRAAGIPSSRVILFDAAPTPGVANVPELVKEGLKSDLAFKERQLKKGESKTKIAFLSFSSGTTGKPKVCNHLRSEACAVSNRN
jgi:4-coumarate--CoA ligase